MGCTQATLELTFSSFMQPGSSSDSLPAPDILLVEDNPGDARLLKEALRSLGHTLNLTVVEDGEEAIHYLRSRRGVLPRVIFLDLNLPRKDGRQVLAEIKGDPVLRRIPVIVLTTSEAEPDILNAYQLQANCYIHKPTDFDRYLEVVKSCEKFWFHIVRLPDRLTIQN